MVREAVIDVVQHFSTVGGKDLKKSVLEAMEMEDIEKVYHEVMDYFFLPKVTQELNNLNK